MLDAASAIAISETCAGNTVSLSCDSSVETKVTPYVSESFYGKKTNTSQGCRYL